jgi:hypothetical protein
MQVREIAHRQSSLSDCRTAARGLAHRRIDPVGV